MTRTTLADGSPHDGDDELDAHQIVCLNKIEPLHIDWLWPGYIPFGMVSLIVGDPGAGKGTLTVDIAARLSRGDPMPGYEHRIWLPMPSLLLTTAEDDLARVVVPRLRAAGADLSFAHAFTEVQTLPDDLDHVEWAIRKTDARFVVFDPLNAYLAGRIDSHKDADIRRALAPVKQLAERTGAAIVLVSHFNKSTGQSAGNRVGGSIAIPGVARSVLYVGRHPQTPEIRVLAADKVNLVQAPPSLTFTLHGSGEYGMAAVKWGGTTDVTSADLAAMHQPMRSSAGGSRQDAEEFYRQALADGERASTEVEAEREAAGISDYSGRQARRSLGVRSRRVGFGEGSAVMLRLPDTPVNRAAVPVEADTPQTDQRVQRVQRVRTDDFDAHVFEHNNVYGSWEDGTPIPVVPVDLVDADGGADAQRLWTDCASDDDEPAPLAPFAELLAAAHGGTLSEGPVDLLDGARIANLRNYVLSRERKFQAGDEEDKREAVADLREVDAALSALEFDAGPSGAHLISEDA